MISFYKFYSSVVSQLVNYYELKKSQFKGWFLKTKGNKDFNELDEAIALAKQLNKLDLCVKVKFNWLNTKCPIYFVKHREPLNEVEKHYTKVFFDKPQDDWCLMYFHKSQIERVLSLTDNLVF